MRRLVLVTVLALLPSVSHAQSEEGSIMGCLPPPAGTEERLERCILDYSPPPLLRQDIDVYDCSVTPYGAALGNILDCLVYNGSDETVESFDYGVRLFEPGRTEPLVESGFEGRHGYTSTVIDGYLHPGETLVLYLAGPAFPLQSNALSIVPLVQVLSVRVPGSMSIR